MSTPWGTPATDAIARELATISEHLSDRKDALGWVEINPRWALTGMIDFSDPTDAGLVVVTSDELGHIMHPLDETYRLGAVKVSGLSSAYIIPHAIDEVADPDRPEPGLIVVAQVGVGDRTRYLALTLEAFQHHFIVVGRTGSGKSTLLKQAALGQALANGSLFSITPHGQDNSELATAIVAKAPHRVRDLLPLSPVEGDRTIGLNPLDAPTREAIEMRKLHNRVLFASELNLDPERETWSGPMALLVATALMEANLHLSSGNKLNLLHLPLFFTDAVFRAAVMARVTDPDAITIFGKDGVSGTFTDNDCDKGKNLANSSFVIFEG